MIRLMTMVILLLMAPLPTRAEYDPFAACIPRCVAYEIRQCAALWAHDWDTRCAFLALGDDPIDNKAALAECARLLDREEADCLDAVEARCDR